MTGTELDPRAAIDAMLEAGDLVTARELAAAYWRGHANASTARYLLSRIERFWPAAAVRDHRVAVLRSFTVEPVVPLLQAEAALAGCRIVPWVGEFNAWAQEILARDSGLYAHQPDTVIVAVQTRDIAPDLWGRFSGLSDDDVAEEVEAAAARVGDLVVSLRGGTTANILVHGLEPPLDADDGLLGHRRALTQFEAIAAVNRKLRQRFADLGGVVLIDIDALQARYGRARFRSEKKWATAKLPLSVEALAWLASDWWRHVSLFAMPQAKVLALDLDNTLWGGVVGEDGLAGLALSDEHPGVFFRAFQRAVLDMAGRGVLVTLVSKNNLDDAMRVFDEHPGMLLRRQHLAGLRVNWEPKVENLVGLAQELNLGLESFVFLDDNPVERDAVRRGLPQVMVPELGSDPSTYADILRSIPALERLSMSAEDTERTRYYVEERQRRDLQAGAETVEDFLGSLDIRIEITEIDAMSIGRAAQLTQKTNQLNLTTRRYSEPQLAAFLQSPDCSGFVLRSGDRFGDNGIVGVALTRSGGDACEIDTLLLSCRVIGRQIETALLAFLADRARNEGRAVLRGWYLPTAKNPPAREIYARAGFLCAAKEGAEELWAIDLSIPGPQTPPWIRSTSALTQDTGAT